MIRLPACWDRVPPSSVRWTRPFRLTRLSSRCLALLVLLGGWVEASNAAAKPTSPRQIMVLPLEVEGMPATHGLEAWNVVTQELKRAERRLNLSQKKQAEQRDFLLGAAKERARDCAFQPACLAEVGLAAGADILVVGKVRRAKVTLVAIDVGQRKRIQQTQSTPKSQKQGTAGMAKSAAQRLMGFLRSQKQKKPSAPAAYAAVPQETTRTDPKLAKGPQAPISRALRTDTKTPEAPEEGPDAAEGPNLSDSPNPSIDPLAGSDSDEPKVGETNEASEISSVIPASTPTPPPTSAPTSAAAAATPPTHDPITEKWWFWTIIGAVIAGGAASVVLLSGRSNEVVLPDQTGTIRGTY